MLLKETIQAWMFGLLKIPLVAIVQPRVLRLDENSCEVRIPLNYLTSNHIGSMYFGALAIGVDLAGGLFLLKHIRASGKKVDFIFKDFRADFLKLAKADVHFFCYDGRKVKKAIRETLRTGERVNQTVQIIAKTPSISGEEPVGKFLLTLSVKAKEAPSF